MANVSTTSGTRDCQTTVAGLQLILVAPNLAERMGGEAIKSLQFYEEVARRGIDVHQVTHGRVRDELSVKHPEMPVTYVEDDRLTSLFIRFAPLRVLLPIYFMWRAAQFVRLLHRERPGAIVHYTSPISPVLPIFDTPGGPVVVGPLNGNIPYPRGFRAKEGLAARLRWLIYPWALAILGRLFPGKRRADVILVAGGERTRRALRWMGCRPERFRETLDSGVSPWLGDRPRLTHRGRNLRFVHAGRLVPFKGTAMILKALSRTRLPVELDVIGGGSEQTGLEALAHDLNLQHRVRFEGLKPHAQLVEALSRYRAFVLPSLGEANGIVVQESMVLGLPVICLDWGGPSLLVEPEWGVPIQPRDEEYVVTELASAMDRLAEDGDLAERMSIAGRERALNAGFLWPDILDRWLAIYQELLARRAGA